MIFVNLSCGTEVGKEVAILVNWQTRCMPRTRDVLPQLRPKHRADFYCRLSLRERTEKRVFRGAKGDTYLPHDAMIKILHVLPAIAPRYGGPSTAIRSLCDAQSRQENIEIEVVATDADGASGVFNPKGFIDCCPVHLLPRTVSEQWKYSRGLRMIPWNR